MYMRENKKTKKEENYREKKGYSACINDVEE